MWLTFPRWWVMADNPDEWFDVVDSADRVVGRATRREVHLRGLLHRAVHILVQNSKGEVFVQKRSIGKDTHPGKWDSSSSGHLDSGEGYPEAARRELHEELGVRVPSMRQIGDLEASEDTGFEFVRIFHTVHDGPFHLNEAEISDGRWVSPGDLAEWIQGSPGDFPPCFHSVWRAVGKDLG